MLCRALCTSSAMVWALYSALQLFYALKKTDTHDLLTGKRKAQDDVYHASYMEHYRLASVQIALSYLWVSNRPQRPHVRNTAGAVLCHVEVVHHL